MFARYIVVFSLIGLTLAKLPDGLVFCSRNDPNLDKCALKSASAIIPQMKNGIPEWNIPVTDPLRVEEIQIANDPTFEARAYEADVYGLTKIKIKSVKTDMIGGIIIADVSLDRVTIKAKYDGTTRILVPLTGRGPIDIVATGIEGNATMNFKVVPRKGTDYMYFNEITLKIEVNDFTADFKSSENAGGPLDEAINSALNDDRPGLLKFVLPTLEKEISKLVLEYANEVCKVNPFDKLFPLS